ncbi:transforming growth factor beta receptor type 3 [Hippocampus comes]|uniref:transforming growth factor beta receptor type 3 n=1 Tax=Hippocampus comes TaxID=109280 RepID=UPI00094EAA8C|nr:PREDICTED: transforming growth factor beta receptor type 3-like [Hippocampus comes]XP_019749113.1 PREDICTED: transforming growth factor beta receptor type 3-like [Hippocampus comes]XP_019749114.1 PREDICTED: transforming growth factor beta receptor type 3-like [Hippocampus comes]
MPSLSGMRWTVFYVLLLFLRRQAASSKERQCSVARVGALHPVEALLEKFEAGPGCAARESGSKETHVIAVGRGTSGTDSMVTILLKPLSLSLSKSASRKIYLLLSSKQPISWRLEAERLPPDLPVIVKVSSNSSVQSQTLSLLVRPLHWLPFRPRALYRWALKHHGNLSSLTHVTHGNRVYVRLGEDLTQPPVCQLKSMFVSNNYMTSDLQPQEVQGCGHSAASGNDPEVHVIKLHSAGSGLCGSLQVEVIVSLVAPSPDSWRQKVVLILSSSVPVNWAVVAHDVRGHILIHSSNSVSPPYPPEPELSLTTTLIPDLSTIPDLLAWAKENGYRNVTSYTEADQANRFVIQLVGTKAAMKAIAERPAWAEERHLREWLAGGARARRGRDGFAVQCEDGRLSVAVDQRILQSFPVPVSAVTLRDPTCQAQSNGSHFLLVFPVISCGTEGQLLGQTQGVQYKNTVLLWKEQPATTLSNNETDWISSSSLGIQAPWVPVPDPGPLHFSSRRLRSGPLLLLKLFVTESYKQRRVGPCVITADQRVYVEISAKGPFIDVAEVKSCVVSPLSDPKTSSFWAVIRNNCLADPSLTFARAKVEGETEDADEQEEELEDRLDDKKGSEEISDEDDGVSVDDKGKRKGREEPSRKDAVIRPLRFSFILRPVYNVSMQFLHCSLHLCVSDKTTREPAKKRVRKECPDGKRIPPLVSRTLGQQCEIRNLSRPMVVTQPVTSLARKAPKSSTGLRTKRLSVSPLAVPASPQQRSSSLQTGPLIGIALAAFVLGVSLMAGLWYVSSSTVSRQIPFEGEVYSTDPTRGGHRARGPSSPSDELTSSV